MGILEDAYKHYSPLESALRGDWKETVNRITLGRIASDITGYTKYQNTKAANDKQISYNDYMSGGNLRAYQDWMKNVGSQGRTIRYPELSYPGAIAGYNTGSARAMYNSDSAFASFAGSFPYRAGGLYGVSSRLSRRL